MTCAINYGCCSLIGLLVVMSVVVVLVLLLFSFLVDGGVGVGGRCLSTCSLQSVAASCFGWVASCPVSSSVRQLPASSCSSEWASVPV